MSFLTTTIGEQNPGGPLQGTDQFVIERIGGANFKVDFSDIIPLPIGANDTVLTADSAEATGMKWASAGGGGGLLEILDSTIMPALETDTLSLSWAAVPFDGTANYIEVVIMWQQSEEGIGMPGGPGIVDININNIAQDELFEWAVIQSDNEDGIVADNSSFEDLLRTTRRISANKVTYLRLRIYMGASKVFKSSGGPNGEWHEGGTEAQNNSIYTRNGTWQMNDFAILSTGIFSIQIVLTSGVFSVNSTAIAYKRTSDIGPIP